MPVTTDFSWIRYQDGILNVSLEPPVPIGGWEIEFKVTKRFGSDFTSGYFSKCVASGFNGMSGINITNSGQGQFEVSIQSQDTSGMDYGAFAAQCNRISSGARTPLTIGYINVLP